MKIKEILIVKNKKFRLFLIENVNNFIDAQYYYFLECRMRLLKIFSRSMKRI